MQTCGNCSGAKAGGEMGLERPNREELPALQDPEGSRLLTVRSVALALSQLLIPVAPLPADRADWGRRQSRASMQPQNFALH